MPLYDTHAHLYDDRFAGDLPAVLARAAAAGVERILTLGIDAASSRASLKQAVEHDILLAAVGIQPNGVVEAEPGDWDAVVALAESSPRVAAIGETGLDRYWDRAPFALQEDYFARHLELAHAEASRCASVDPGSRRPEDGSSGDWRAHCEPRLALLRKAPA